MKSTEAGAEIAGSSRRWPVGLDQRTSVSLRSRYCRVLSGASNIYGGSQVYGKLQKMAAFAGQKGLKQRARNQMQMDVTSATVRGANAIGVQTD